MACGVVVSSVAVLGWERSSSSQSRLARCSAVSGLVIENRLARSLPGSVCNPLSCGWDVGRLVAWLGMVLMIVLSPLLSG